MARSHKAGSVGLPLLAAGLALAGAFPASSRDREQEITTYFVEIGRGNEVIGRTELRVAGERNSSFERRWPGEGTASCIDDRGQKHFAVAGNSFRVVLQHLDRAKLGRKTVQPLRITGFWRTHSGMPSGLESVDCEAFPGTMSVSSVSRTAIIEDDTPVILTGDDGLFVKVIRQ